MLAQQLRKERKCLGDDIMGEFELPETYPAEAEKEAMIKKAEGEAEAILKVQEATAAGIKLINEAAPSDKVIAIKSLEAFEKAADGKATKIIIPSEIQSLAGLATSLTELVNSPSPEAEK